MIIDRIKSLICRDLLWDVDIASGRTVAITSLFYPNGDSLNLIFDDASGGEVWVSDGGGTLCYLRDQRMKITPDRKKTIEHICRASNAEFSNFEIRKATKVECIGATVVSLCEAASRVSAMTFHLPWLSCSSLPEATRRLLNDRIGKERSVEYGWIDRRHDHDGAYPVDVRVNGISPARHLFTVTSPRKSLFVSAASSFLRSRGIKVPTMAIVDKESGLGKVDLKRLQLASDEIRFGLDGHESDVIQFAMGS